VVQLLDISQKLHSVLLDPDLHGIGGSIGFKIQISN
jgi:hypothetical protein